MLSIEISMAVYTYQLKHKTNSFFFFLKKNIPYLCQFFILNKKLIAGKHTIEWSGKNEKGQQCSSVLYFYKLKTKKQETLQSEVSVKIIDDELIFSTKGNLYGFEVEIGNMDITKFETEMFSSINGNKVSSGIFFYKLESKSGVQVQKLLLLK